MNITQQNQEVNVWIKENTGTNDWSEKFKSIINFLLVVMYINIDKK
jgi:hypothetical protein